MDKDTLYFNIKNTYFIIFSIIIINLQINEWLILLIYGSLWLIFI